MPIAPRTFRVFVSSTFEDLKAERDALQSDVFPMLRKFCEERGARFQAIDLRWGVRDEAALDQQTMEICLREIGRCQQTGIKPNFIVLLGERYGWRPLPARIEAGEFRRVCDRVVDGDKRQIGDWYECDDDAVPPEFLLKPRTGAFADPDRWTEVEQEIHQILQEAAQRAELPPEVLIKYEASATHQEILKGIGGSEDERKHVFAFLREPSEETKVDPDLRALKEELERKLPKRNVYRFQPGAVEKLCHDVEESLKQTILDEVSGFTSRDAQDLEVEAHDRFAADRCRIFVGRTDALTAIENYISGAERRPLVLHGASGAGKSAVMAKASEEYKGRGRVIRRFIGASPDSVNGFALLTSLCKQIAPGETPVGYAQLVAAFKERLTATAEQPLIIFIDALDQLAASDPARAANWLPAELPPHVKIVVSTTDDVHNRPAGFQFALERMTMAEGGQALDALLHAARRKLQPWQREKVLAHFERCGLPLYLKLAAEESRLWKSYSPPDVCQLGEGVAGIIDTLFDRLSSNANHGAVLVDRSLGFLAAARYGLTETEMLDVLAADDAVWNDFDKRKHHELSERRLPVVVWSRLSLDLEPYLTERAAPGGMVVAFYHRQLAERAATRFLAEDEARHVDLVKYFLGAPAWLDDCRKNPNARRAAELVFQQRAARQWQAAGETLFDCPFLFAKVAAGMVRDLDDDYKLLLRDTPAGDLEDRDALRLIQGALQLSLHVVAKYTDQFAPQIVGRLLPHEDKAAIRRFTASVAENAVRPWLKPLKPALDPPGTELVRTLAGHTDMAWGVAVTPDGRRAVSASKDATLKVWDLETGNELRTLAGHSSPVAAVAVTPDGRRIISASWDKTLKVWDLETGTLLRTLAGHSGWVNAVAVMPNGFWAFSASWDKTLKVWFLTTGKELGTIAEGFYTAVVVTPDGRRAVFASRDATLKVWDCVTGKEVRTLAGHCSGVSGVAVTPDGLRAVSASTDNTLKIWDLETGKELCTLTGHSGSVAAVAVTPDGLRAVSASFDRTLKVWDLETGKELRTLVGHSSEVQAVAVAPDGRRAISASCDKTLKLWNLEVTNELRTLAGHSSEVQAVAVTPDGRRAISASEDNTLKIWDFVTGNEVRTLAGHSSGVRGVAVTPDGLRAVSASIDNTLKFWDLETGKELCTLTGHSDLVSTVALTPDGRRAVSASWDKTLKVWDLTTGKAQHTLIGHSNVVDAVVVTPDGRRAVSASWDNTLKVWGLETGKELCTLTGHSDLVSAVALTLDGRRAVSASWDKTLKVWDLTTGKAQRTLRGHLDVVDAVVVTPDGRRAVSASRDATLKVWDMKTGKVLRTLAGHSGGVRSVAVTQDGLRAVSASFDQTLKVWDLATGATIATFVGDGNMCCCAFVDDGTIIAGDIVGHVYILSCEECEYTAQLNIEYQKARRAWEALPWWTRLCTPTPKPPSGI